jgi:hypothetical protein
MRGRPGAPNRNWGKNQPSWLKFTSRHPIAITSELRNQLKVHYRFSRGVTLGSCLYHRKNPFHVLETLANNSRCCVLSTRVGGRSGATTEIREEPIAYLLDKSRGEQRSRELSGLFAPRLLSRAKRTGWRALGLAFGWLA